MSLVSEEGHLPGAEREVLFPLYFHYKPASPVNVFYIILLPQNNSLLFAKVAAEFMSLCTLKAF